MTQDELRAALLLMGFRYGRKNSKVMYGKINSPALAKWISVVFNITNENVRITHYIKKRPRSCSYDPQSAFDFIKRKLS